MSNYIKTKPHDWFFERFKHNFYQSSTNGKILYELSFGLCKEMNEQFQFVRSDIKILNQIFNKSELIKYDGCYCKGVIWIVNICIDNYK